MPDELLERIREAYRAWNEGDLQHTLDFLDAEVQWKTSGSFPGVRKLYVGHDGFREFWEHLHGPFDEIHIELESYEREGEFALLRLHFHGKSVASGVDLDLPWFQVARFDGEKITDSALNRSVGDALDALDVSDLWPEF